MDEFFRRVGGEDGALSWALTRVFGNRRLVYTKRVRMHYHSRSHAVRYFRVSMGMLMPDRAEAVEAIRLSSQFVVAAEALIRLVRTLNTLAQTVG